MRDEILVLRAENQALREQLLRERAVGLAVRFVFDVSLCGLLLMLMLCL
jgi:tetrahydromethanopterin S-methyltransferase subunit F